MAQEGSSTPEKQLLKLIEEPKKGTEKVSSLETKKIKRKGYSLFSLGALKGRLSFFKENIKKGIKGGRGYQLDIKVVNQILGVLIAILAIYLVINFTLSIKNVKDMDDLKFDIKEGTQVKEYKTASLLKEAAYYLEKVKNRDIFSMVKAKEVKTVKAPTVSDAVKETQHLKLVGISWSDNPDVMIEDTKTKRTHFLKQGQMFDDIKLEEVYKDRVILKYKDEQVELR